MGDRKTRRLSCPGVP